MIVIISTHNAIFSHSGFYSVRKSETPSVTLILITKHVLKIVIIS